jgi:hypothetical protein
MLAQHFRGTTLHLHLRRTHSRGSSLAVAYAPPSLGMTEEYDIVATKKQLFATVFSWLETTFRLRCEHLRRANGPAFPFSASSLNTSGEAFALNPRLSAVGVCWRMMFGRRLVRSY